MSKPTRPIRSGCIYMIAGTLNVAQAVELSDTKWAMKNYDGSVFLCSEDKLRVACKEDIKMWCIANKQHTTDFPALHGQGSLAAA